MGVLRGVAEERVEVLDGVKKPPYQAVENSLTGATTQTLADAHFWPMGLARVICASSLHLKYIFSILYQEFLLDMHTDNSCDNNDMVSKYINVGFVCALH